MVKAVPLYFIFCVSFCGTYWLLITFFFSPMKWVFLTWSHTVFKQRGGMGKSFIQDAAAASTISSSEYKKKFWKNSERLPQMWGKESLRVVIHLWSGRFVERNVCCASGMCMHMKEGLKGLSHNVECNVIEDTKNVNPEVLHYLPLVTVLLSLFLVLFK